MDLKKKVGEKNLFIEQLNIKHIDHLRNWGLHEDPLLWEYNLSNVSSLGLSSWYFDRKKTSRVSYFAVMEEDRMVGYFGFRNIDKLRRSAVLGIALDPNLISKGYGSRIMPMILDHFFYTKNMSVLKLEVNNFNDRAINLYKKFAFKEVGQGRIIFPIGDESLEILNNEDYFIRRLGRLYSLTTKMQVTKEDYNEIQLI